MSESAPQHEHELGYQHEPWWTAKERVSKPLSGPCRPLCPDIQFCFGDTQIQKLLAIILTKAEARVVFQIAARKSANKLF
jgi:hypothetical protein